MAFAAGGLAALPLAAGQAPGCPGSGSGTVGSGTVGSGTVGTITGPGSCEPPPCEQVGTNPSVPCSGTDPRVGTQQVVRHPPCTSASGCTQFGSERSDLLSGGPGNDVQVGNEGLDHLFGEAGDDRQQGGADADGIRGGPGNDVQAGGGAADDLDGGQGADELDGGADNNDLNGGPGPDSIRGGPGNDVLRGEFDFDTGGGDDKLDGGDGSDVLRGARGQDGLLGGAGNDTLNGGPGLDQLTGGSGNDTLNTQDGETDHVPSCGTGTDTATIDLTDPRPSGCETINRQPVDQAPLVRFNRARRTRGAVTVRLRCVRRGGCRGTLRVASGRRTVSPPMRFSLSQGRSRIYRLGVRTLPRGARVVARGRDRRGRELETSLAV